MSTDTIKESEAPHALNEINLIWQGQLNEVISKASVLTGLWLDRNEFSTPYSLWQSMQLVLESSLQKISSVSVFIYWPSSSMSYRRQAS
ncbi:hypothetical protein C2S51_006278 [Perilla frutescens var. frutescens]|nr:hypothetical protein C2S51_006278 [Perilla frutescens var. frutescens]